MSPRSSDADIGSTVYTEECPRGSTKDLKTGGQVRGMGEFVLQLDGLGLQQMGLEFGGGGLIGGIIGFAAKKVAKLIAVIVGIELALFKFLETRGILEVNWNA